MYARSIHWFRRDLRLGDNSALHAAASQSEEVVPLYVISPWQGSHLWTGPARQDFLCGCLESLEKNLGARGAHLIYRRGDAVDELHALLRESEAQAVFYNRDPDPFGRATEERLEQVCRDLGVACHGFKDVVLHEPEEVLKGDGTPYRVFTPYLRRWLEVDKPSPRSRLPEFAPISDKLPSLSRPDLDTWKLPAHRVRFVRPGEKAARARLSDALENRLLHYEQGRDVPSREATSRLSQDLRFGTISIRKIHAATRRAIAHSESASHRESLEKFVSELAWREFYMQILHHFPEVLAHEFNPDYRGLPWAEPGEELERWKRGETGFPIVDAGMRELAGTGFMHNRVRMIVAMFLTKDLRLDWRLGEQFFMQSLVDGEIASNNGGWQWSAGTGADAAPYFRIQNPWTQTERYDPEGTYIRRWVPELADAPPAALCKPPAPGASVASGYPKPVVDHAEARKRTLAVFKKHLAARPR